MGNILQNIGSYFSDSTNIDKFFNTGLELGANALNTSQQVSQINAQTEQMKAQYLLEQEKAKNAETSKQKTKYVIIGVVSVAAIGAMFYYFNKK